MEIRSTVGMGAKLEWCLEIMAYCDQHSLIPQFRFSYPDSGSSEDYFSPFFSIKGPSGKPPRFVKIASIVELELGKDYDGVLSIELAHHLINKYLVIREEILEEVEDFCSQHFAGRRILGVHYRGTDKIWESFPISYDTIKRNIEYYLCRLSAIDCIFVASDDANFIRHMEMASFGPSIIFRDDAFRSHDGTPIHQAARNDRYELNRDAILNCLILSRCDALIKTTSILSGWSKLFNPQLPIVVVNKSYDGNTWFPERELVRENIFEPIP